MSIPYNPSFLKRCRLHPSPPPTQDFYSCPRPKCGRIFLSRKSCQVHMEDRHSDRNASTDASETSFFTGFVDKKSLSPWERPCPKSKKTPVKMAPKVEEMASPPRLRSSPRKRSMNANPEAPKLKLDTNRNSVYFATKSKPPLLPDVEAKAEKDQTEVETKEDKTKDKTSKESKKSPMKIADDTGMTLRDRKVNKTIAKSPNKKGKMSPGKNSKAKVNGVKITIPKIMKNQGVSDGKNCSPRNFPERKSSKRPKAAMKTSKKSVAEDPKKVTGAYFNVCDQCQLCYLSTVPHSCKRDYVMDIHNVVLDSEYLNMDIGEAVKRRKRRGASKMPISHTM